MWNRGWKWSRPINTHKPLAVWCGAQPWNTRSKIPTWPCKPGNPNMAAQTSSCSHTASRVSQTWVPGALEQVNSWSNSLHLPARNTRPPVKVSQPQEADNRLCHHLLYAGEDSSCFIRQMTFLSLSLTNIFISSKWMTFSLLANGQPFHLSHMDDLLIFIEGITFSSLAHGWPFNLYWRYNLFIFGKWTTFSYSLNGWPLHF